MTSDALSTARSDLAAAGPAPAVDRRVENIARAVAIVATVWFAMALFWGMFARVGSGHDAVAAARAIIAENMRAWHILGPVRDYTLDEPGTDQYYAHHPWGTFWLIAAVAKVLGRGAWVPRLVSILLSLSVPPMLYGIGRALWGPVSGALAAVAYVVLPITLAFGNFPGFEGPLVVGFLLVTWGYLRFAERWQRRWMAVSLLGVLWAVNVDWEANVFLGLVLGPLLVAAFFVPGHWFPRPRPRPFVQWAALAAAIAVVTLFLYVWYFHHIGALENLLQQDNKRSRGSDLPLENVLGARRYWIDVTFTPVAVTIGKIAAPLFLLRILVLRRVHEIFPVALLVTAGLQYVRFKNGADVHIYWPLPFAPYWALSLGMLGAVVGGIAKWILKRRGRVDRRGLVPVLTLTALGLLALAILPDGVEGLHYAKSTGGRFNEKGARIFQDRDKSQAMEWMAARMEPRTVVQVHDGLHASWGQEWAMHRPMKEINSTPYFGGVKEERYFVGDLRFLSGSDQRRMFEAFHGIVVGPYVFVDREAPKAPLEAYAFDEREPTFFEWYWTSPTEPIRTIRPDPWSTWELRDHYGQAPNPPPAGAPQTLEQMRIAHNVAVVTGDAAGAEKWKAALLAGIDTAVAARFSDGTQLLGKRFRTGVDPTLDLYFLAQGPLDGEYQFEVASVIDARRFLSLVPRDDRTKRYGPPFALSPRLWRRGLIYVDHVDIRHRPGIERFAGYFDVQPKQQGNPPKVAGGNGEEVPLMTLK